MTLQEQEQEQEQDGRPHYKIQEGMMAHHYKPADTAIAGSAVVAGWRRGR